MDKEVKESILGYAQEFQAEQEAETKERIAMALEDCVRNLSRIANALEEVLDQIEIEHREEA